MSSKISDMDKVCHVCGKSGAQRHFGGICCAPCKMFFRRNVQYKLENNRCQFGDSCDITKNTRHICRICRFKKCLAIGMEKELLRASRFQTKTSQVQQSLNVSQSDLFQHDRLLLTSNQWNVLLNVIHDYDQTSPTTQIREFFHRQSTYPPKIRMKLFSEKFSHVFQSIFRSLGSFLERLPEFCTLKLQEKVELLHRNLRNIGRFSGMFLLRETNLYTSPLHYTSDLYEENLRITHQYNVDETILKLFLVTLVFSTCTDVVQASSNGKSRSESMNYKNSPLENDSLVLVEDLTTIQNVYVDILFKYMLYRYGLRDAVLRFAKMTKTFLDKMCCFVQTEESSRLQNEIIENIRYEIITNFISANKSLQFC
ncbi:unnamed protein product [Adineta ricciae]|uniref:Nuclear receptor domain-containing protein n=1 Tax=Adineta ricciae TaxID=249248 RepID=A0A816DYB0_ADIRI|nr:unnamed protein product [Adineta ricciae]